MASCPNLAAVIKQVLANIFPNDMRPIELDRIEALYFDTAEASSAFDPQQFTRDLR
jgi:hypothetical protein